MAPAAARCASRKVLGGERFEPGQALAVQRGVRRVHATRDLVSQAGRGAQPIAASAPGPAAAACITAGDAVEQAPGPDAPGRPARSRRARDAQRRCSESLSRRRRARAGEIGVGEQRVVQARDQFDELRVDALRGGPTGTG